MKKWIIIRYELKIHNFELRKSIFRKCKCKTVLNVFISYFEHVLSFETYEATLT